MVSVITRSADPDIVTELGLRVAVRPGDGDTAMLSVTLPENPLTEVTVTIDVPGTPGLTVTETGLAVRVKSVTAKVTEAACVNGPVVAVTVTV